MLFWYEVRVAYTAGYINSVLKPKMDNILSLVLNYKTSAWIWENANAELTSNFRVAILDFSITTSRYLITIIPAILLIISYFSIRLSQPLLLQNRLLVEIILLVFTLIAFLMVIATSIYTIHIYAHLPTYIKK